MATHQSDSKFSIQETDVSLAKKYAFLYGIIDRANFQNILLMAFFL